MIHQIADENGTLKHIILSVMDSVGDETLESTVITLPQGTFRIDSNGELVCTNGGTGSDNAIPLTTLPQQPYFANYDGCPVGYNAQTLPDNLETPAPQQDVKSKSGDQQRINNKHQILSSSQTTVPSQMPLSTATSNVNDGQLSGKDVATSGTGANSEAEQMVYQKSNPQVNVAVASSSEAASLMYSSPVTTTTNTPTVTATAVAHHNQELELMNGGQIVPTPMLTTVDGQLYGYPPAACCCCCSYCDPTQEAASQALVQPSAQDGYHPELILAPPSEPAPTSSNPRMSSRGSGSNLNVETSMVNGMPQLQYGVPAIMGPSMHHQTSMASLHGATTVTPPVGLPTMAGGTSSISNGSINHHSRLSMTPGQISSSCVENSSNIKIHCGPRGSMAGARGPNGYNKHNSKLSNAASLGNNQNIADRSYMNHYQHHNNILCDQHYHDYHHNDVAGSTIFAGHHKSHSMSNHKGPALSSSSGSSGGFYPSSYNNSHHHHHHHHNSSSTSTMASIVSSSINNKSQQQQQHSTPSYRGSESGSENLPPHHQRNNPRDQVSYNIKTQHSNNNDNKRQISNDSKLMSHHHQNHNHNHPHHNHQHQNNQHNVNSNRYATNVKVISNSSHSTIAPILTQTSVSPIRTRMKGNNNPPMSTPSSSSNGVRPMSSGHFNHHHHHHQLHCSNNPHDIINSNNKDTAAPSLSQQTPVTHIPASAVSSQYYYQQQQSHHLHNQQNLKATSPSTSTSYAATHSHQQENLTKHINQSSYSLNNTHNRNNTAWQGSNKIVQQNIVIKNNPDATNHEETNRTSSKGNHQESASAVTTRTSAQMLPKDSSVNTTAKVQQQDASGNDSNTEQNTSRASRVKQKKCQISSNNTTNSQSKNPSNQRRSQAPPKQQSSTTAPVVVKSTAESTTLNLSASKLQEGKVCCEDMTQSGAVQEQEATYRIKTAELSMKRNSAELGFGSGSISMRSSSLKGRLSKQHEEPTSPDAKPNVQLELIKDDILVVSLSESTPTTTNTLNTINTSKQTKHQQSIRTSLSENNIKSLEVSSLVENSSNTSASVKSTQTTPQKIASSLTSSNSGSNLDSSSVSNNPKPINLESPSNIWMNVSTSSPVLRKKSTSGEKQQQPQQQRKSSNARSEQKTGVSSSLKKVSNNRSTQRGSSDTLSSLDSQQVSTLSHHHQHSDTSAGIGSNNVIRGNTSSHHSNSGGKFNSQPIKFSNLFKQCRSQFIASLNKLVKNSLSSYSDTKFAGILLVLFTTFAILLALFIHLYIVAPVNE